MSQSDDVKFSTVAFILGVVLASVFGLALAANDTGFEAGDNTTFGTNTGLDVQIGQDLNVSSVPFKNDSTVQLPSGILHADGPGHIFVPDADLNGTPQTYSEINATQTTIWIVSKDDSKRVIGVSGDLDNITRYDMAVGDDQVDFEYAGTGTSAGVHIKGLPSDTGFAARDATSGYWLDANMSSANGTLALTDLPLYVDEDPEPTLGQIRSRVMQVQAHHDVALVGVDYDEKVDPEEAPPSEEQRVAAISKGLKTLAKEEECACVALSQYNSAPSSQVRPGTNDDLRYSRKKKHEAHTILHWYWPAYWLRSGDVDLNAGDEAPPHYNPAREDLGRLYVGKDRDGGPGWVALEFHAEKTAFVDPNDPANDIDEANPEPAF